MYRNEDNYEKSFTEKLFSGKGLLGLIAIIVTIVALVIVGLSAMVIVEQGEAGIIKTWGQVTNIVPSGMYFKNPIADSVEMYNLRIQDAQMEESTGTKDQQSVTTEITVNYHVPIENVKDVYTRFGQGIETTLIVPRVQECLKASTSQYSAEQLTLIRETVKVTIDDKVKDALLPYGIIVDEVSITEFSFSPEYQAAIDAAQTAKKNAETARNHLAEVEANSQIQVIQAEANATAILTIAQANANATIINANATASAMEIINSQLSPEYIAYLYALQWNGQLPSTWVSGNNTAPYLMLQVPTATTNPTPAPTTQP